FKVDADTAPGLGREVRLSGSEGVGIIRQFRFGREQAILLQERCQSEQTDTTGRRGEKIAARLRGEVPDGIHVSVSNHCPGCPALFSCPRTQPRKARTVLR